MRTVEFGSLFEFIRNGMNVKQDKSGDGLPISRIETIWNSSIDPERVGYAGLTEDACDGWLLSPGDILFSHINSVEHIGKCAVYEGTPNKLVHGMNLLCLRCKPDSLLPEYAKHLIRSVGFRARLSNYINKAVNQASVSIGNLKGIEVTVPPLPEQRRIAAILDKADALRTKRREALTQLDRLAQSIFVEMFGDPVTNPKGWPKTSVGQLLSEADVFVDGDWVESKDQDPNGEVRLIQLADVGDGFYVDKSARFLNKPTALRLKCTSLKPGDVLIARMPDPLGRACIFPGDHKECVTVVDVCIVRPSLNGPDPVWLMSCINNSSFRNQIAGEATGTTRTRISRGNLSKLDIIAPPLSQQHQFANRYQAVAQLRQREQSAADELETLFASLQHRAFRGEL